MAGDINPNKSKGRGRRSFTPNSQINVTPLVDVMLVLLVVFMVTAPMLTVGVPVDLPKTKGAKMNDQTEPIVVTINAASEIYLQSSLINLNELTLKLKAVTNNNPDAKIYVRGDQKIPYGKVMELMGFISQAGFKKVSLITQAGNN